MRVHTFMSDQKRNINLAYSTQKKETVIQDLNVIGEIPVWLQGNFISTGPAQFEVGNSHFKHWFDGFAMLKHFQFNNGKVSFRNRFLQSQEYLESNAKGRLYRNGFASHAHNNFASRMLSSIKSVLTNAIYDDNCIVNTQSLNGRFIAMTESSTPMEFNVTDLSTVGLFKFEDKLKAQMELAHPHWDNVNKEMINICIEIGKYCLYHIYKVKPGTVKRELIYTYQSDQLFYLHTFSITQNHIILYQSPLEMDKFKLFLNMPFNETLSWNKDKSSTFIIINRKDKSVKKISVDAFFCYHSVNAYEKGDELVIDLICYKLNDNPYNEFMLANLKADSPKLSFGELKRFVVDLQSYQVHIIESHSTGIEFPRLNYKKFNGHEYQYFYSALITDHDQKFFNAISKQDMISGKTLIWQNDDCFPGEPVFIAKPNSEKEDEGVLLSIFYDAHSQCSGLVILDSQTMHQLAQINLPFHLPFGLHGNFYTHM